MQMYLQIALNTGMRQGKILKLKWDDIDCKRNKITVRDTKNGSNRVMVQSERQLAFGPNHSTHPASR